MVRLIDADDLISREAAKAAIRKKFSTLVDRVEINIVLNGLPAVDAVPVVRCKECKMWNTEWNHEAGDCYCYKFFQFTDPDFFCAGGERREADNG